MLASDRIKRLNRLYAVSSGINEAIVRVPDEAQLYLEACRIAVERGGFVMAWVGRSDPEAGCLVPVARWGRDEGYVDSIRISTEPGTKEGMGPGGMAFRSGEAAVSNDIEADDHYFAFRSEALAHGYRSCAAFPLKRGGKAFAVFFVYAAEPLYFDEHELALLNSLAENFSFAIEARDREVQRRKTETALRASESRLRAVIENEPECVKLMSSDGVILDMNPAGLEMLDAESPGMVLGRDIMDFAHPDDRQMLIRLMERVLAGETASAQVRAIGFKGRMLWMDMRACPLRDEHGAVTSILSVTRDVSEQKEQIARLQNNQSLLAMASRLGRIGAWSVELATGVVTWSEELRKILGVPPGFEPKFEDAFGVFVPEHREFIRNAFGACATDGIPFDLELAVTTTDGMRLDVRSLGEPSRDASGRIVRVQGALQDVSEQMAVQQEILNLNVELEHRVRLRTAQLEVANHELEAFSFSVAHDLRAPLMAIGGFGQALENLLGAGVDDRAAHFLRRMREGVQRTSDMIDALLSLAQLSRTELRWESVNLSALAQRAVDHLAEQEPQRKVSVHIQPGLAAEGDTRLLQLVMDNLVGNAWKFSAGQPDARIEVTSRDDDGETIYSVRDNGAGFDMAYAANLFGAFQRLHTQGEFPGTGIGLANVRRIISRHSGRVWAESAPGEGATFYFTLGAEPS